MIINTDITKQLIGSWSLVSFHQEDAEGKITYPFGENATGIIMYTPDGYMSAQIMRGEAAPVAYHGTPGDEYLAYTGRYHITADQHMLQHDSTICNIPEWLGRQQQRPVHIEGDFLHLSSNGPTLINDHWVSLKLVWKRNPVSDPTVI
ncbi:MAG: lipocalin-like domain-containing protein [Mucilaginibacter sp.]